MGVKDEGVYFKASLSAMFVDVWVGTAYMLLNKCFLV